MARNSTERLGGDCDLESRGFTFSCTPPAGVHTTLPSIYKYGSMLVLRGVVFSYDPLYCCSTVLDLEYLTYSFVLSS